MRTLEAAAAADRHLRHGSIIETLDTCCLMLECTSLEKAPSKFGYMNQAFAGHKHHRMGAPSQLSLC